MTKESDALHGEIAGARQFRKQMNEVVAQIHSEIESVYLNGPAYRCLFASAEGVFIVLKDLLQDESTLLGPESKRLLFSQQNNLDGKLVPITLGWHVGETQGMTYLFKEGGGAGYHSEMRIHPDNGYASAIMSNRTSFDVSKRLNDLDQVTVPGDGR